MTFKAKHTSVVVSYYYKHVLANDGKYTTVLSAYARTDIHLVFINTLYDTGELKYKIMHYKIDHVPMKTLVNHVNCCNNIMPYKAHCLRKN